MTDDIHTHTMAAEAILKWETCRGPKAGESRWDAGTPGRECPLPAGRGCPLPAEFLDLQIMCFSVFCGAKFNILVTIKSCKNHTLNAMHRERERM